MANVATRQSYGKVSFYETIVTVWKSTIKREISIFTEKLTFFRQINVFTKQF